MNDVFPQASVTTNVFTILPAAAQVLPGVNAPAVLTGVNEVVQLSVAVGTKACAAANPAASLHSTVLFNEPAADVNVGLVVSLTVMVCIWFAAALPQLSTKLHVLVMILLPWQDPFAVASVKVACKPVEQLSASLVTSPVTATLALNVHVALV